MRIDGRKDDELRPISIQRGFHSNAEGSVLISAGDTVVLCTASVAEELPKWMPKDSEKGWLTAEYRMLPGSTKPRSSRGDRPDGRATEIQRLIGRSLRAITDLALLKSKSIHIDCDVLKADGGTRTLSITGAYIALADAIRRCCPENAAAVLKDSVAAVSIGIVDDVPMLDLRYTEDVAASVDMNLVMTGNGRFIEIQGTGEEATYSEPELHRLIELGKIGIARLSEMQRTALA